MLNQTGTTTNNYLYTGQQFDSLTGLYSLRARYYAPGLGRFLSQDTYPYNFGNPVELNRYGSTAFNFRTPYVAPTSLTPAGAVIGLKPIFDWADVNGATGYTIQVSRNAAFTLLVVNANTVSSTYTPLVNLPAATLYWRVRATGSKGPGPWTAPITITVAP